MRIKNLGAWFQMYRGDIYHFNPALIGLGRRFANRIIRRGKRVVMSRFFSQQIESMLAAGSDACRGRDS